jgi:hypothetical protein
MPHRKIEPASLDANLNVGLRLVVWLPGPAVIELSGAIESST